MCISMTTCRGEAQRGGGMVKDACLGLLVVSGGTRILSGKFKYARTLTDVLINNFPTKKVN